MHLACAVFVRFPPYEWAENGHIFPLKKPPVHILVCDTLCIVLSGLHLPREKTPPVLGDVPYFHYVLKK